MRQSALEQAADPSAVSAANSAAPSAVSMAQGDIVTGTQTLGGSVNALFASPAMFVRDGSAT